MRGNCKAWNTWELGTKQPIGGRSASACSAMLCRHVGWVRRECWHCRGCCGLGRDPTCQGPVWRLSPGNSAPKAKGCVLQALLFWALPMEKMKFMALAGVLHGNLSTPKGIVSLGTWLPAERHKRSVTVCFGNRTYLMLQMFYQLTWLSKAMALILKWIASVWTWSSGVSSRTVGTRACLHISLTEAWQLLWETCLPCSVHHLFKGLACAVEIQGTWQKQHFFPSVLPGDVLSNPVFFWKKRERNGTVLKAIKM